MTSLVHLLLALSIWPLPAAAQSKQRPPAEADSEKYITRDRSSRLRFEIGLRIEAAAGHIQRATATVVDPIEWPEQQIRLVDEKVPAGIQVAVRSHDTAQQLLIKIPGLAAGSSASCTRIYELTRWTQRIKPEVRSQLAVASAQRVRSLLLPSPGIESRHEEIRKFANESIGEKTGAWDRVQAIFDATRQRIKYEQGAFAGALEGLRSRTGDCEELSCLFIAACRSSGIPARLVWGPEHTWAEFALEDSNQKLVWIPSDPSKERELGVINHFTPILQKGDRFLVPEMPGKPQRYLAPICKGSGASPILESIEKIEPLDAKRSR